MTRGRDRNERPNATSIHDTVVGHPDIRDFLQERSALSDDALADEIRRESRRREAEREPLDLGVFLDAIEDLDDRPAALDAAIEAALRSMQHESEQEQAVERLLEAQPEHADAIVATASLYELFKTPTATQIERVEGGPLPEPPLKFGPAIQHGRRRYLARPLIASGSEGSVFESMDRLLSAGDESSIVAAKILRRPVREEDASSFAEEAIVARRVEHPQVVRVFDTRLLDDRRPFVIHALVDGLPLGRWAATTNRERWAERAERLIASLAGAVQSAHAAGFVHCDLKPANVMVRQGEEPVLVDFGIARRFTTRSDETSVDGGSPGTSAFAPPKQVNPGTGRVTVASDVYALGGMLHWLLTDDLPAEETLAEIRETFSNPDAREAIRERSLRSSGVGGDLRGICQRALATDPSRRYASAAQLSDDLGRWA